MPEMIISPSTDAFARSGGRRRPAASTSTTINIRIERVVIDEAMHRAGADAVRAAVEAQMPALLAAEGLREFPPVTVGAARSVAAAVATSPRIFKP